MRIVILGGMLEDVHKSVRSAISRPIWDGKCVRIEHLHESRRIPFRGDIHGTRSIHTRYDDEGAALNPRPAVLVDDVAIMLMMFRHGLRTAELVALRWQQVGLKAGYLDVQRVKRGHHTDITRNIP